MNRGDIETFYPIYAGGLQSSSFCCGFTGKEESGLTGDDLDDSKDDQESVEFEDSDAIDAGGVSDSDMPSFRQLVRAKKLELKAQYGKGKFNIGTKRVCTGGFNGTHQECKNVPYPCPTIQNPLKKCDQRVCVNVPTWDPKGGACNDVPDPLNVSWIPGWRKQWRIFKRDGGLAQLKMKAKGLLTPQEQAVINAEIQANKESLIIAQQQANTTTINKTPIKKSVDNTSDEKTAKTSKMFIFGVIALVIIIAILLIIMVIKGKKS